MAHGFSAKSLAQMEPVFDRHALNLRKAIDRYADSGETFDIKEVIAYYAYDVLGELAFSTQFNSQDLQDPKLLPPINEHILLASVFGCFPALLPYSMRLARFLPFSWLKTLLASRARIQQQVAECVRLAISEQKSGQNDGKTLLTQLIAAKDPETQAELSEQEICSEAFGFLVAGSHTTSGTLTLLIYHLLYHPEAYARLVDEIQRELPALDSEIHGFTGLESKLPFMLACIRENFRVTPVFTMPLVRTVASPEAMSVNGVFVPPGVSHGILPYGNKLLAKHV